MKRYVGLKEIEARPKNGSADHGYNITYMDGYKSWSPRDVFEESYQCLEETFDYSVALYLLKNDIRVYRKGWNGKGLYINLQHVDEYSKMGKDYTYIYDIVNDEAVPWVPSQTDQLAKDWMVYNLEDL